MERLLIITVPTSIENNSNDKYFFVQGFNHFYSHALGVGHFLLHPVKTSREVTGILYPARLLEPARLVGTQEYVQAYLNRMIYENFISKIISVH